MHTGGMAIGIVIATGTIIIVIAGNFFAKLSKMWPAPVMVRAFLAPANANYDTIGPSS
jgi:hypothetical protein